MRTLLVKLLFLTLLLSFFVFPAYGAGAEAPSSGDSGLRFLGAGLAIGLAALGAGIGIGSAGAAAIASAVEDPKSKTWGLVIVALAEGLAVLGFALGILILQT
ncbi:MAG: ATPase [Thaumarchaeota archaeon]|nr:ATPase [Nitrososphaerota archaeon]